MTDEIASNPFADMSPDVPQETVRDYAAALVKNGMSVDEINRHLSARNAAPLVADESGLATKATSAATSSSRDSGISTWSPPA